MPFLSQKCSVHKLKGKFPVKKLVNFISLIHLLHIIKPHVIYTNLWTTAHHILNAFRFFNLPIKFIFGLSNTIENCKQYRPQFNKMLQNEEITIILQTNRIYEQVKKIRKSAHNLYSIPNIVDPKIIQSKCKVNLKADQSVKFQLIHIGSFTKQKRHDRLLKIVQLLKQRQLDFEMNLVGDGPLKANIINESKQLKLDSIIKFHGYVDNPFQLLSEADVLLLTSDYEGMPMVLIEALTLGIPVVSTDIEYGPREIIEYDKTGYYVDVDNLPEFADKIIAVLKNRSEFSNRAIKSSKKYYVQNNISHYLKIFQVDV